MNWKNMNPIQAISVIIIILLIANLVFFAFKRTNTIYFWIFIVLAAIYAFFILPVFMKKGEAKESKEIEKEEIGKKQKGEPKKKNKEK